MKVEASKNEYNHIEFIVRKHKKVIAVSTLAENSVSLETYYLTSSSVDYDTSSSIDGSTLIVAWSEKENYIIDLRNKVDKEKADVIVEEYRLTTHKMDKMNFSLDLAVYYITNTKEKNNTSAIKSK
jgi:hypothetical protein